MGACLQCPFIPCRRQAAEHCGASSPKGGRRPKHPPNPHATTTTTSNNNRRHRHRPHPRFFTMGQTHPKHKLTRSQIRDLQRHVSFSEAEIQDWYQEFCQAVGRSQHDLYLSEEAFVAVYNDVFPGKSGEFARHVFRTFDLDENRKLDFREFLIGLSLNGSEDMQKKLAWAFQVYDVKRSGFITLESTTQIVKAVFKMIGAHTLRHRDTTVTPESFALELFQQMDKNGDQLVSWREFREAVQKNPTALQILQCCPPDDSQHQACAEDDNVFYR